MMSPSTEESPQPAVHIVTDSFAHLPDGRLSRLAGLTVLPNRMTIGGRTYLEGVDISAEEALRLMRDQPSPPTVTPPSTADYAAAYARLIRETDMILSIHASREVSASWANARKAAQQLAGNSRIGVIDSRALCVGQGMLVAMAAEAGAQFAAASQPAARDFDSLVRQVRGMVERVYAIYCVDSVDYLLQNRLISPSHGILGAMLGIKPFITIEDGRLMAMEKVRTRLQAVERMVEFVIEFENISDAMIVQPRPGTVEATRILQDRLAVEFPERDFPHGVYSASLAALIGTDASGIVIVEAEAEDDDRAED
jgi:DegV family protein with EDD domain